MKLKVCGMKYPDNIKLQLCNQIILGLYFMKNQQDILWKYS